MCCSRVRQVIAASPGCVCDRKMGWVGASNSWKSEPATSLGDTVVDLAPFCNAGVLQAGYLIRLQHLGTPQDFTCRILHSLSNVGAFDDASVGS